MENPWFKPRKRYKYHRAWVQNGLLARLEYGWDQFLFRLSVRVYDVYKPASDMWATCKPYVGNPLTYPFRWVFALGRRGSLLYYYRMRPDSWPCIDLIMDYTWQPISFPTRVEAMWKHHEHHRSVDKEWII